MGVVLDASTALAVVLPDEGSTFARAAVAEGLSEGLFVPALWPYDIQNGLVTAYRRGRIDDATMGEALDALRSLAPEVVAAQRLGRELRLALAQGVTAYDAAYLAVALATGARLATDDRRLREAARAAGIALVRE